MKAPMTTIEKNIPIPKHARGRRKNGIQPTMRRLQIGDSFLVEDPKGKGRGLATSAKNVGIKITTRSVEGGIRVWRIE